MLATACILFSFSLAFASEPTVNQPYPPMPPGQQPGSVSGRVTACNINEGIVGAGVAIVNASNTSIAYATCVTDQTGNYTFANVNSTDGQIAYRIFVLEDGFGEGYSNAFGVEPSDTAIVPVIMLATSTPTPSPAQTPYPVATGTGHVSGRIKMANGQGAMGTTVIVVNAGNFDYTYGSATTDDYGFYDLDYDRRVNGTGISADDTQRWLRRRLFGNLCSPIGRQRHDKPHRQQHVPHADTGINADLAAHAGADSDSDANADINAYCCADMECHTD